MAWPGTDDLGLRQALPDRLLGLLVGAMVFLAALAGAGSLAAAGLARHWRGAGRATIVQVPDPAQRVAGQTRAAAVATLLGGQARRLDDAELTALLRPWLGTDAPDLAVALPAVFTVPGALPDGLRARLTQAAAGTTIAQNSIWQERLQALAASLQACAALALAVVACVSAALMAVATRAGLAARHEAIEIVHGLGATDGMIAGRFSRRVGLLAFAGGTAGALLAVPMLLTLARVTAPFQPVVAGAPVTASGTAWFWLAALPVSAALLGWLTAQLSVRVWLRRLA